MSIAENWKLLDDSVSDQTLQYIHLDGLFCIPVTNVHHGEGEIAFESQGPNHGRSVSDLLSIHPDRLRIRAARSRITVKHYPSDGALGTILSDAAQGFCANVVQRAIQTTVGIQIALQWVVGSRHFVAVRKQASLNALDEVGAARSDVELLSGIPKRIPQLLTQRALIEVDLKPPCLL